MLRGPKKTGTVVMYAPDQPLLSIESGVKKDSIRSNTEEYEVISQKDKNDNDSPSTDDPITMIMVVVLFLCCNTLALVVNLIESFFDPDPILVNLLTDASNFLVIFNSSVNCVIYYVFNPEFREIFDSQYLRTCLFLKSKFCGHKSLESLSKSRSAYGAVPRERYAVGIGIYPKAASEAYALRKSSDDIAKKAASDENTPNSPIWRPLSIDWIQSPGTDVTGLNTERVNATPSQAELSLEHSELLLLDEDSGWDDGSSSQVQCSPKTTSYFAEVQIMENDREGQPYICVKPVYRRSPATGRPMTKMSITEL
jgi:hypothetical protein